MIRTRKITLIGLIAAFIMAICCFGVSVSQVKADTAIQTVTSFSVDEGAYIRKNGNGIQFTASLGGDDYTSIVNGGYDSVTYGYFIMPKYYAEIIGELNEENCFTNPKYIWDKDEAIVDGKYTVIHGETMPVEKDSDYQLKAAVIDMMPKNIATDYVVAFYVAGTTGGNTEYKFAAPATESRSMLDVAVLAAKADSNYVEVRDNYINAYKETLTSENMDGSLYKGELFYFGKNETAKNYSIKLPNEVTVVAAVKVGEKNIEGIAYDAANKILTVPVSEIADIACGDMEMEITANKLYTAKVTVADYVATDAASLATAMSNFNGKYVVVGADIDGAEFSCGSNDYTGSTFDGKGHVLTNVTTSSFALFGRTLASSTIKNVAFVNLTGTKTGNAWMLVQVAKQNTRFENIFISGTIASSGKGIFQENNNTVDMVNCIISCQDAAGYLTSTINAVKENVILDNGTDLVDCIANGALPEGFGGDFSIYGPSLFFDGKEVFVRVLEEATLLGSLYNDELYYFGKNATVNYVITLPEEVIGNVYSVKVGGTAITGISYDVATKALTVPVSEIAGIACGEMDMVITANKIYTARVTVADYVATDVASLETAMSNFNGKYVVLGADITGAKFSCGSNDYTGSTFDGKGHVLTNVTTSSFALFGRTLASSTIKNVAFVNLTGTKTGNAWMLVQVAKQNTRFENIFISGTIASSGKGIFQENNNTVDMVNCIISCQDAAGYLTSTINAVKENVILDNGTNLKGYVTAKELPEGFGGDFGFDALNNLTFNGKIVLESGSI